MSTEAHLIGELRSHLLRRPPLIVVVGDLMLDRYVDGTSTRLSPEAPVPVVAVTGETDALGGAANVAAGLAALSARVRLLGLVGEDAAGARVVELLAQLPLVDPRLVVAPGRPTTTKERVRVDGRHVIRVDREVTGPPAAAVARDLEEAVRSAIDGADVLVVSDYAKGAVTPQLLEQVVGRLDTVIDPKHADVERYRGATVLTPNRAEAVMAASGGNDPLPLEAAMRVLVDRLPGTAVVVTCGADGIAWTERHRQGDRARSTVHRSPSLARRVDDVTGAGDSVVCGLALSLATGGDLATAIVVASAVAAAAVGLPGTATPTWGNVEASITD